MKQGSTYYFYHNDHLGTPQQMTDMSGAVVWSARYSSFGQAYVDGSSGVTNHLRFPGQYYDGETGLHYNFHRFYDPEVGRYLRIDPVGFNSGDMNLYRYCLNDPIVRMDPSGLEMEIQMDQFLAGAAITFVGGAGALASIAGTGWILTNEAIIGPPGWMASMHTIGIGGQLTMANIALAKIGFDILMGSVRIRAESPTYQEVCE